MGLFRWLKQLFGDEKQGRSAERTEKPVPHGIEISQSTPTSTVTAAGPEERISESIPRSTQVSCSESLAVETTIPTESDSVGWKDRKVLSGQDVMQMARKLQSKGELHRAEQLLRDGVNEAVEDPEYWLLLAGVEESLNRKGRAYYCIEQILHRNATDKRAQQKMEELRDAIDTDLSYFIEYKLAPEFYRLQ